MRILCCLINIIILSAAGRKTLEAYFQVKMPQQIAQTTHAETKRVVKKKDSFHRKIFLREPLTCPSLDSEQAG